MTASEPLADERRDGEEPADLLAQRDARCDLDVQPGESRLMTAGLAPGEMAGDLTAVAQPGPPAAHRRERRLHLAAALAGDEVVVLGLEALAGAEEGALDGRAAHAELLADLCVGTALELAEHDDVDVRLRQRAQRALEALERLACLDRLGDGPRADQAALVGGAERLVVVVGDLLGPARAPVRVDARVLGDLVDPGSERDRAVRVAHAAQRVEEHLLGDVLGATVVAHHAADVRGDPALITLEEDLERAIVSVADACDELVIVVIAQSSADRLPRARHRQYPGHLRMVSVPGAAPPNGSLELPRTWGE